MERTYWKISLPSIAIGCLVFCASGTASAQSGSETVTTTSKTQGAPQVLNSEMVPTLMQTKETTTAAGDTIKETAPMIQERHEQVLVPQQETTTSTTIEHQPPIVTEEKETHFRQATRVTSNAPVRHRKKHVAYRATEQSRVATNLNYTRTKRVVQQPVVARTQETVTDKSMIYERRDPALDSQ